MNRIKVAALIPLVCLAGLPSPTAIAAEEKSDPPLRQEFRWTPDVTPQTLSTIVVGPSLDSQKPTLPPTPAPKKVSIPAHNAPQPTKAPQVSLDIQALKNLVQNLCDATFGPGQFVYLDRIINAESGWNISARNKDSGAYGLGQALPASKMAPFGADYMTNGQTQARWLMDYIGSRYGNPASAWSFHIRMGWY